MIKILEGGQVQETEVSVFCVHFSFIVRFLPLLFLGSRVVCGVAVIVLFGLLAQGRDTPMLIMGRFLRWY